MAKPSEPTAPPFAVPVDEARKIVAECRKCLEEDAENLTPAARMRMLAIMLAMEAEASQLGGFSLRDINAQIRYIASGDGGLPAEVVIAARRATMWVTRTRRHSFFTSYISGRTTKAKTPRFNSYLRSACQRLGLDFSAVIGGSPDGEYAYYYLKYGREDSESTAIRANIEQVTSILADGAPLLATRGWGADELGRAYKKAREIEASLTASNDPAIDLLRFEVALGLWSHNLVRGDFSAASAEAARLREIALRGGSRSMRVSALRALGTTALCLGRFRDAERDLRECLRELGDGSAYRPFAADLGMAPYVVVASNLTAALFVLGRQKEAQEMSQLVRKHDVIKTHPFQDCYSLMFSSWIKLEIGDLPAAAADAANLLQRATDHNLPAMQGMGWALDGIIRALLADDPTDGVDHIYRGFGEWQASGSSLFVSSLLTKAASIWLKAGNARQAERALNKAFEFSKKTGDGFYLAEMHRLRGDIAWTHRKHFAHADIDLRAALDLANEQEALTYRLRAATSLLRLAQAHDDLSRAQKTKLVAEQTELVRDVLTKFADESDSADLQAARAIVALKNNAPAPKNKSRGTQAKRRKKP